MSDQKRYLADEGWLPAAIEALRTAGLQVIAPIRDEKGAVNLAPVGDSADVTTDYVNVQLPLKRVLFPATESLLSYEKGELAARKLAMAELGKARRARSRKRFNFWNEVVERLAVQTRYGVPIHGSA